MSDSMPFPLSLRQQYEFDLLGFVVVERFITESAAHHLSSIIDANQKGKFPRKFPFLHLGSEFLDILSDKRILEICNQWIGPTFRLDHAFGIQVPPPDTDPQAASQEDLHGGPYANQSVFRYNWFNNRPLSSMLVFDLFLEPVNTGDGGLVLLPGSHKHNMGLAGKDVFDKILQKNHDVWWVHNPAMQSGDLLIFNEAVVHGTRRWTPVGRRRRNLHYSFSPGYQANRDPRQLEKYINLARTETERRILRPPYVIAQCEDDGVAYGKNTWRSEV